jgi:Fic-DOC domain mobile mystery protein B
MKYHYPPGATPLDPNEATGLIPKDITLQSELNEWEQKNILEAESWAFRRKHNDFLTVHFIQKLHRKMFDQTWKWAGQFRETNKNIGVEPYEIPIELTMLLDNVIYQLEHATYPIDEIAARLHHRLVWIHPFPNGNGRHSRLYADLFLISNGKDKFTWGKLRTISKDEIRTQYIAALREADNHNFSPLFDFVRS